MDRSKHLLRAANAAIHLQAMSHRKSCEDRRHKRLTPMSKAERKAMKDFLDTSFFHVILEEGLIPDSSTLEVPQVSAASF